MGPSSGHGPQFDNSLILFEIDILDAEGSPGHLRTKGLGPIDGVDGLVGCLEFSGAPEGTHGFSSVFSACPD